MILLGQIKIEHYKINIIYDLYINNNEKYFSSRRMTIECARILLNLICKRFYF